MPSSSSCERSGADGRRLTAPAVRFALARSVKCFGLLGPNGAGKMTTIEICEGLTARDSGEAEEILRELAFHVMVERGLADSGAQRIVSNEETARRIRSWRS